MTTKTAPVFPGCKVTELDLRAFVREVCEFRHRANMGTAVYILPQATRWGLHYRTRAGQRVACVHDCLTGKNVTPWRRLKDGGADIYADFAKVIEDLLASTFQ